MVSPVTLRLDLDLHESLGGRLRPEVVVVQQDRNLVMGDQEPLDLELVDDLDSVQRALAVHRPVALGRCLLRRPENESEPWRYEAVVHDLDMTPSSRPGDVRRSLCAVLRDASRRGLRTLACEPLGVFQHHGLTFVEMVDAFDTAVMESCVTLVAAVQVTLLLDDLEEVEEISSQLRARMLRRASRSFRTVDGEAAVVEVRHGGARLHVRFVPGSLSGYLVSRVGLGA